MFAQTPVDSAPPLWWLVSALPLSRQDHGYVMSFGVDGFTGFLASKDCDRPAGGLRFRVGQPLNLAVNQGEAHSTKQLSPPLLLLLVLLLSFS